MRLNNMLADSRHLGPALVSLTLLDLDAYGGVIQGNGVVTGEICEVDDRLRERRDEEEDFCPADPQGS
jgi:gamma-glutamylcyclotransferase (GGCT)/AIG2-like uncharacterized protein YtfP